MIAKNNIFNIRTGAKWKGMTGDLFGSYSKGTANPWSDIDVAVILPSLKDEDWLELSADLWHDVDKVSLLIEPVLMSEEEDTILYRDVIRTGITA